MPEQHQEQSRTYFLQYGMAIVAMAVALAVGEAVHRTTALTLPPIHTLYLAVAIAVWFAGVGPAVIAAVLGFAAGRLLFLDAPLVSALSNYLVTCAVIIALGEAARRARVRADANARRAEAERARHMREAQERRAAELEVIEAHRRTSTILRSITECFFVLDRQWRYVYVNEAAERYFKRPAQALIGRIMWEEFPEVAGTAIDVNYRTAMVEGVPVHFESLSPVSQRWLSQHVYPSDEGITVIFSDRTRRKRAQELAERNAAFLRLVADAVSVPIAYFDSECCFRFLNRRYAETFGVTEEHAIGKKPAQVLGEPLCASMQPHLERAFAGESITSEATMHVPGQGERHMIVTYRPDRDEHDTVRGVVVALSDISERVAAERALLEADHRKDEFLATLAHELRNPLAPMLNAVQLLRLRNTWDPQTQLVRDIMDRQVHHMARLVDDLLDVSRITLGRINLQLEDTAIESVIASAVEASRPLIDASRHELSVHLPSHPVYVKADATRLSQVFLNLLNNAAKYTPSGGRISLRVVQQDDELVVSVKDTGAGIPPEMLTRIFDIFAQVDRALERAQGGLGIGLTLASRLVEMHGGTLRAHSEGPGKGSEFTVRLPISHALPDAGDAPADSGERAPAAKRRVVVVDDNVDSAVSLSLLVQTAGHETQMAHDGIGAVALTVSFRPDVVLLDIGLPRLNGYEAAQRIRAMPDGHSPVLVALTGWGQEEDKRRAAEAGFDLHLTKPVDPDTLIELINDPAAALRRAAKTKTDSAPLGL